MNTLTRHVTRCFIAGIVAMLPIGGLIFSIVQMESVIADSWLRKQPYYFPGMGLIVVGVSVYAIGLTVTTFIGKWLWSRLDRLLDQVPLMGAAYQTLKQIVGYGKGKDAVFKRVVLVASGRDHGEEIGLVTNEVTDAGGASRLVVFVPGAPNPTAGRLLLISPNLVRATDLRVSDALQSLVAVGATELPLAGNSA
jgi:uncharacterized membrane protein